MLNRVHPRYAANPKPRDSRESHSYSADFTGAFCQYMPDPADPVLFCKRGIQHRGGHPNREHRGRPKQHHWVLVAAGRHGEGATKPKKHSEIRIGAAIRGLPPQNVTARQACRQQQKRNQETGSGSRRKKPTVTGVLKIEKETLPC